MSTTYHTSKKSKHSKDGGVYMKIIENAYTDKHKILSLTEQIIKRFYKLPI